MAKPEWGAKRQCKSCGAKFYDLNRMPVMCPKCEAELVIESAAPSRPPAKPEPKAKAVKPAVEAKPAKAKTTDGDELLELEDEESADEDYLEDASELGEDEEDMSEVIDKVGDDSDA